MPIYIYTFILSILLMFLFVPLSIKIGYKYDILDKIEPKKEDEEEDQKARKKVHSKITPRTGGIAIFLSFWLSIFITIIFNKQLVGIGFSKQILGILLGSLFLFIFMLYDDKYDLSPKFKLIVQFIAASIPIFFGVKINFISNIFTNKYYAIGIWGIPLTIVWCVALVNALNLIDGLDGLAAGIAAIASMGIVLISLSRGLALATTFGISVVACCLVFLRYNFYPSKIILGDNGAQFLGYIVAMIAVLGGLKTSTSVIIVASGLAFGLPIFDIIFSITTRLKKKTPIYKADLENIHYQLYKRGWSQKRIAILFYLVTFLLFIIPYFIFFYK
jgi:UDP-GlcNAc:undecaprenyl-phosphate/decaprenyl-phosphate GlcNAc-1-phosphate transferase